MYGICSTSKPLRITALYRCFITAIEYFKLWCIWCYDYRCPFILVQKRCLCPWIIWRAETCVLYLNGRAGTYDNMVMFSALTFWRRIDVAALGVIPRAGTLVSHLSRRAATPYVHHVQYNQLLWPCWYRNDFQIWYLIFLSVLPYNILNYRIFNLIIFAAFWFWCRNGIAALGIHGRDLLFCT